MMNLIMDQSTRYRYAIRTALMVVILLIAQLVRANNPAEKYIEDYRLIAVQEMEKHRIPASITLAQGMLESGYGESLLAKRANNHFGIKCHSNWNGERYYYDDDEEDECFRVYPNAQESFLDHSDFLVGRQRYAKLFTFKITDYKKWAIELKRAGYATNPNYPSLLISLINKHNLDQFDRLSEKDILDLMEKEGLDPVVQMDGNTHDAAAVALKWKPFQHNRINTIIVNHNDQVIDIAKYFGISKTKLRKWNDLYPEQELIDGQMVYLQPKRSKGERKMHQVAGDETMYDISQLYGIRLEKLIEKNRMEQGEEPAQKEWINLRKKRKTKPKIRSLKTKLLIPPEIVTIEPPRTVEIEPHEFPTQEVPKIEFYTVESGDTLYRIAKQHGLSVSHLREMNRLPNNEIHPGDEIRVR